MWDQQLLWIGWNLYMDLLNAPDTVMWIFYIAACIFNLNIKIFAKRKKNFRFLYLELILSTFQ